jgi:hypothetical protein
MSTNQKEKAVVDQHESKPFKVRLPGFILDKEIGLGDAIKRASYAIGSKPCAGCEKRAAMLNRWMVFRP